ncbi:YpmS family protein [Alkalibacterium kapii]|uniref:DUF2140 domain-containing protein n=1 Tax=Alkalibacterium kapii TaxID=426704 RepID=A0A511ATR8_9LACT|nr:YpmS family protein [Alkalibacterium kapii]GEK91589.1 hypothetical protein AKA01nite_12110 [Alkalibacterium kapii]
MTDRRGSRSVKKTSPGWKWAFILLLGINIGIIIWLTVRLDLFTESETIDISETETLVDSNDRIDFDLVTDKSEVSKVTNIFLDKELDDRFSGYTLEIEDLIELKGPLNILGFEVDFGLFMEPLVMDNGNLQLRIQRIQLGSFDLPQDIAMNILDRQLELPEWIRINSEEGYILVAFDQFSLENNVQFEMKKIDLPENDIRINIILPEEAIK